MDRLGMAGAAAVVGFVGLVAYSVATTEFDHGSLDPAPDPVEELIDAWERSRHATHRSMGTFERVSDTGARLAAPTEVVQRPPDRLVRGFDEVSGRRDTRALTCPAPLDEGGLDCSLGPPGPSYAATVDEEVGSFAALVVGDDPLYLVSGSELPGCYDLTRTRYDPRSGYGQSATICFDDVTGALASIRIDHGTVTETTVYDDISPVVTDEDLEP